MIGQPPFPFKFGAREPKNAPALLASSFLTGVVPAHPASVDYLARLRNWQVLGNADYGDCVAVTWANNRRLVTATLTDTEYYPNLAQVLKVYTTQNPSFPAQDNGMDAQTLLEHLHLNGGPDGVKLVAFAKVDHTNRDEVEAATAIAGGLWTGLSVQRANQDQFNRGEPWDVVPGSPIEGRHLVFSGGYLGVPSDDERFITWAAETGFTDRFWDTYVDELWLPIWPEHLGSKAFQEGVDVNALAAAYLEITGRVLPIPAPVPVPFPPVPGPGPSPASAADTTLANATRVWAGARHSGANRLAARAVQAWLKAKGL